MTGQVLHRSSAASYQSLHSESDEGNLHVHKWLSVPSVGSGMPDILGYLSNK